MIGITVWDSRGLYCEIRKAVFMALSKWRLNSLECVLFTIAVALGALLVAVRVGALFVLWYVHHPR